MFDRLLHADWSVNGRKRSVARATRAGDAWQVDAPEPVGDMHAFVDELCAHRQLAGFDFPIGLPVKFGTATNLPGFVRALPLFGDREWSEFFEVASHPDEISIRRPFYPTVPGGRRHEQLCRGLAVATIDELRRRCERRTPTRGYACPLFWTLGGNQVGKAAIDGWQAVIRPALQRGCKLWPFEGDLDLLAGTSVTVLAETYPAEAYGHVLTRPRVRKTSRTDRARCAPDLHAWARRRRALFTPALVDAIDGGFEPGRGEDDAFDALLGVLGMIETVDGHRPDAPADVDRVWEGWIFGQHGTP